MLVFLQNIPLTSSVNYHLAFSIIYLFNHCLISHLTRYIKIDRRVSIGHYLPSLPDRINHQIHNVIAHCLCSLPKPNRYPYQNVNVSHRCKFVELVSLNILRIGQISKICITFRPMESPGMVIFNISC